jgi:DNA invertase Pin-like site-specific DNA recombinase
MIDRRQVAYIRRSTTSRSNPGDLSRDFQIGEVRRLAGTDDLRIMAGDWGRSAATDKTAKRLDFLELMEAVERGECSTIFAYSCDRLARSVQWAARLLDACEKAQTTITTGEGTFAPGDDGARITFQVLAVMNENAVRAMTKKTNATFSARRARGDVLGHPAYGYHHERQGGKIVAVPDATDPREALRALYTRAGSVSGAVNAANEAGIPSPKGKKWCATTMRRVLEGSRMALPPRGPNGRRISAGSSVLSQLVRCHCLHVLTPNVARKQLYCSRGMRDSKAHGRYVVREADLRPWIREEVAHLRIPFESVTEGEAARLPALIERKRRLAMGFADNALNETEYRAELRKIADETDAIEGAQRIIDIPPLNWSAPTRDVNRALRAILADVQLDADMKPVSALWRVPAWRAP